MECFFVTEKCQKLPAVPYQISRSRSPINIGRSLKRRAYFDRRYRENVAMTFPIESEKVVSTKNRGCLMSRKNTFLKEVVLIVAKTRKKTERESHENHSKTRR